MIRGINAVGGADSSVVGGMGVVSIRSSSLRSAESDEIELSDEKSTMVALLCGMAVGPALGVT